MMIGGSNFGNKWYKIKYIYKIYVLFKNLILNLLTLKFEKEKK
jgi:hypothetical protein